MFHWYKYKTDLLKLQERYCKLMKSVYYIAIKNREKSDRLHEEADKVLRKIRKLEHQLLSIPN